MTEITKKSVWGTYPHDKGMVVARGYPPVSRYFTQAEKETAIAYMPDVCPVWGDILPYKSVTVICPLDVREEVLYWLSYVHGDDNISREKELADGKVALRSDYMCW